MSKDDIEQVQDVAKKSWNATYEGIIPDKVQASFLNAAYRDEMLEKRLSGSFMFVSVVENKIVGFANFSPVNSDGRVELSAIYLYPSYQGNGIGTALLQEGIETIKGMKEIYLDVEKENVIGRNFYQAKGFKIIREYDDNFDGHMLKTVQMVFRM